MVPQINDESVLLQQHGPIINWVFSLMFYSLSVIGIVSVINGNGQTINYYAL